MGMWSVLFSLKEKALLEVLFASLFTFLALRIPPRGGWALLFTLAGSSVLILQGIGLTWNAHRFTLDRTLEREAREYYASSFVSRSLNHLLNPLFLSFWLLAGPMLFIWSYIRGGMGWGLGCAVFLGGYLTGSLVWYLLCALHLSRNRRVLLPSLHRMACSAAGLVLAFFGLSFVFSLFLREVGKV